MLTKLSPNGKRTDKLFIINYVNSLEPAQLMFSINYVFREVTVDESKKNHTILEKQLEAV